MKKSLIFIMIVLMAFAFMSCKQPEPENTEPVSKEQGQENLYQQGASGSGKSIDHTGFRIAVTVTQDSDETTFEIGGKNDIYWITPDESTTIFVKAKDKHNYIYASPYALGVELPGQTIKNYIFAAAESLLYVADGLTSQMVKGADDTVGGRACATYTLVMDYEPTPGTPGQMNLKIWVDKEFGFTMKITYTDKSSGKTVGSFGYEITKLELKNATTPDGYTAVAAL